LTLRNLLSDGGLQQVGEARGLLDAGAGLGPGVQDELAVVARGEEVLAQPGQQEPREEAGAEERGDEGSLPRRQAGQQPAVGGARAGAARSRAGCATASSGGRAGAADTWPGSARASARARRKPASRTPPPPPGARTGTAPPRSGRTSG